MSTVVDILFLLFPASEVRRLSSHLVSGHFKKSICPIFTKFGMGVYWVNSLHGIAFGEYSSIANLVIASWQLLCTSFVFGHFKEKYLTYLYQIWYEQ